MSHTASKNPSLSYPQRTLATKAIILLSVLIPLCDAQLLLDPSDGLAFVPPGTRLSQALQQGGFSFPRPYPLSSRPVISKSPSPASTSSSDTGASSPLNSQQDGGDAVSLAISASPDASELLASQEAATPPPPTPPPPARSDRNSTMKVARQSAAAAPHPVPERPAAAPTAGPASAPFLASTANASAPAQPTQIKDLLAPLPQAPNVTQTPAVPPAEPPSLSQQRPQKHQQWPGGHSSSQAEVSDTCDSRGEKGECNACVCCCIPAGSGAFRSYKPEGCNCKAVLNMPDVWMALALAAVLLLPSVAWCAYFNQGTPFSPYAQHQYGDGGG